MTVENPAISTAKAKTPTTGMPQPRAGGKLGIIMIFLSLNAWKN